MAGIQRPRLEHPRRAPGLSLVAGFLLIAAALPASAQQPNWAATAWGGYTSVRDAAVPSDTLTHVGLRFAEVRIHYTPSTSFWVQYDNGLTLDNYALTPWTTGAPSVYLGGQGDWAHHFTTRIELGKRHVPPSAEETLFRGEQAVTFHVPLTLRVGGFLGTRTDGLVEWNAHGGFSWTFSQRLEIGPTVFHGINGFAGQEETQVDLSATYRSGGWSFDVEGGRGRLTLNSLDHDVTVVSVRLSAPIQGGHQAHVLVRSEGIADGASLTMFAVGFTLRGGGH
jgi:hypothetical protein